MRKDSPVVFCTYCCSELICCFLRSCILQKVSLDQQRTDMAPNTVAYPRDLEISEEAWAYSVAGMSSHPQRVAHRLTQEKDQPRVGNNRRHRRRLHHREKHMCGDERGLILTSCNSLAMSLGVTLTASSVSELWSQYPCDRR